MKLVLERHVAVDSDIAIRDSRWRRLDSQTPTRVTSFGSCDSGRRSVDSYPLTRVTYVEIGDSRRRPIDSKVLNRVSSFRICDSNDNGVWGGAATACACVNTAKRKIRATAPTTDDRALHRKDVSENASDFTARWIDLPCLPGTSSQSEMSYLNLP